MDLLKRLIVAREGSFILEHALFTAFLSALVLGAMGFIGSHSQRVSSIFETIEQALK
ncbi:MAG TPA: hypothetical protein P5309_07940 [Syntrophomonadaceae bacterium]|jgi:Flp pilus assembly pilin Flp|nr:hypothetical protein [Syntrophomonadaceae bacterium]